MDDLISRQAAIDALDKRFDDVPMELTTEILQLRHDLRERIPSAQPATSCSEIPNSSDDTISRQAAIYAIVNTPSKVGYHDNSEVARYGATFRQHEIIDIIKALPPAQPERKKPVFETGESVFHVSYADGTGGFEKNKWADWICPDCGWFVGEQYIPRRHNQQKCNYCAKCGCAIDWSDADMRGEQDEHID